MLTANPRRCDSIALTKSLPIAAQRLFRAGLALSVTCGDTSPKGRGFGRPEGAKKPPFGDGAPGGGLSFWVSQWTHLLLPLSLLLYAILRKSQALHRKFTVTLLLAFPVSFWRNVWYNGFAALPAHLFGREVKAMSSILSFVLSVGANVTSYYICKWLDRWFTGRKH